MKSPSNSLIAKGIIKPSGEINKDKINLVAGAVTQLFAEMVWVTTGGDMDIINHLTDVLVTMNTPADRDKLFRIIQMLCGHRGKKISYLSQKRASSPQNKSDSPQAMTNFMMP